MRLIRYPQKTPLQPSSLQSSGLKSSGSITIGNFDGVHRGHQALIAHMVNKARELGVQSVVVTMHPLPQQYFQGSDAVKILTNFKHKYHLIKQLGVDVLCVLNFNQKLASMTAAEFYQQIILKGLKSKYVLVGDDFRFGAGRKGDYELLQKLSHDDGVEVAQMDTIISAGKRVSSTAIRNNLNAGNFKLAKSMLGRDFNIKGRVASGRKIGRSIGYPTINIELKQGAFPLHGIYVAGIVIAGNCHQAVASVGYNPSVGGNAKRVEVYVLNFDQQVYGQCVEVLFYKKLRNEVKFDSLRALTATIEDDVRLTEAYFAQKN